MFIVCGVFFVSVEVISHAGRKEVGKEGIDNRTCGSFGIAWFSVSIHCRYQQKAPIPPAQSAQCFITHGNILSPHLLTVSPRLHGHRPPRTSGKQVSKR